MSEAAQTPVDEQIAEIAWKLRRHRMTLESPNGLHHSMPGFLLQAEMADRLEASIGIRRVKNEDGSWTIQKVEPVD